MTTSKAKKILIDKQTKEWEEQEDIRINAAKAEVRKQKEATKQYNIGLLLTETQNTASNMEEGSPERKKYLKEQAVKLKTAGAKLKFVQDGLKDLRDEDLSTSIGLSDKSIKRIQALDFDVTMDSTTGLPPSIFKINRYKGRLATIIKEDPQNKGVSAEAIQAKVRQITNTEEFKQAELVAIQVRQNIVLQEAETVTTQRDIVKANEEFHKKVMDSTDLTHIEKEIRAKHGPAYEGMSQEDLRKDIQLTLDNVYKHYKPKSDVERSAYARVVYKLYSKSRVSGGGWFFGDDIVGVKGTEDGFLGFIDTSLGEIAENDFDLIQTAMSPHLLPAHRMTAAEKATIKAKQDILKAGGTIRPDPNKHPGYGPFPIPGQNTNQPPPPDKVSEKLSDLEKYLLRKK